MLYSHPICWETLIYILFSICNGTGDAFGNAPPAVELSGERVWDQVKSLNPIWIRSNQLFLAPGTGDAAVEPSEPEEASERQEAIWNLKID